LFTANRRGHQLKEGETTPAAIGDRGAEPKSSFTHDVKPPFPSLWADRITRKVNQCPDGQCVHRCKEQIAEEPMPSIISRNLKATAADKGLASTYPDEEKEETSL